MTQEASAIVSAVIPLQMRNELERRAQENDRSPSSEIRRGLRSYLAIRDNKEERIDREAAAHESEDT